MSRSIRWAFAFGIPVYLLGATAVPTQSPAHESQAASAGTMGQHSYMRSEGRYRMPDLTLTDSRGRDTKLRDILGGEDPVMVQFIFTTCTTICPVLSASFAEAQNELDALGRPYRMVSISIDPEHDTPHRLRDYAERFGAGDHWHFLTGSNEAVASVQKAFDAYYPGNNKMYHQPFTFLRVREGDVWVRFEGLMSTKELVAEYRASVGRGGAGY